MSMFTKTTVLTFSLLALTGVSYANSYSNRSSNVSGQSFEQADKNNDGVIDRKEARSVTGLSFKKADTDNDGKISQSEYQAAMSNTKGRDTNPATSGSMSDTDSGMKPGSSVGTETQGDSSGSTRPNSSSDSAGYSSSSRSSRY